jgi:hypothetical protein
MKNWYKLSQNIQQEYTTLLSTPPVNINIAGSGVNQSISLSGKAISARDLLQKAIDKIKPILLKHNVKEINTNPISGSNVAGQAISTKPGTVYIDIPKLFNSFRNITLPAVSQLDGTTLDPDVSNRYTDYISSQILSQIGNVVAHETQHLGTYQQLFQEGKPFSEAREQPAEQFGAQIQKQYFPTQPFRK